MNTRGLRVSFGVFHLTLGSVVLAQSIFTVLRGLQALGGPDTHSMLIGGIEAIGAVLFLLGPTLRIGGIVMITMFAIAMLVHGIPREMTLLVYAAGTLFVMVHGSVWSHRLAH